VFELASELEFGLKQAIDTIVSERVRDPVYDFLTAGHCALINHGINDAFAQEEERNWKNFCGSRL